MIKGVYGRKVLCTVLLCGLCLDGFTGQTIVSAQEAFVEEVLPTEEKIVLETMEVEEAEQATETVGGIEITEPEGNKENTEATEATEDPSKTEETEVETEETELELQLQTYDYGSKQFTLSWNMKPEKNMIEESKRDLLIYRVSAYINDEWQMAAETSDLTSIIEIPDYGITYLYKVEAYINNGGQSDAEENAFTYVGKSLNIPICFPKAMSKIITTSTSSKKVKLSWMKVDGATEFEVYQKKRSGKYKEVQTISGNSIKLDVEKNKKYEYKVIPVYRTDSFSINATEKTVSFNNSEFVATDHQKYTYKEMKSDIKSLCKKYGEYVSFESIGQSEQEREIYDVILGNKEAENTILVVSTLHSREYVATITLMKQLEYYLMNYNRKIDGVVPAKVFNNCCVHYIMMANPDGVTLCQKGDTRRKNNANNVNLNANFPYKLSKKVAASEMETKAIVSITKKLNKSKNLYVVNYHAMGEIVFGDYGGKDKVLKKKITNMYKIARTATGYADAGGYGSGGVSKGGYREYLSYVIKAPSITIEVGDVWCPVPKYRYPSIIKKNRFVILREAKYANSVSK